MPDHSRPPISGWNDVRIKKGRACDGSISTPDALSASPIQTPSAPIGAVRTAEMRQPFLAVSSDEAE